MGTLATRQERSANRLGILARHRFIFSLSTSLLITVLMTVFVGYYVVFAMILGITVGIGVLLVLSFPPTPQNPAGDAADGQMASDHNNKHTPSRLWQRNLQQEPGCETQKSEETDHVCHRRHKSR